MDERMNGRVAFEYLLLTDWRRLTWQAETGGSWREGGVNYGWTGGRYEGEDVGESLARPGAPADKQAASWWSHLATQRQPGLMGPS